MFTYRTVPSHTHTLLPAYKLRLMELLRLSSADLSDQLREEEYANPLLEVQSHPYCPACGRALTSNRCRFCQQRSFTSHSSHNTMSIEDESDNSSEQFQHKATPLALLLEQCGELPFSPRERAIAEHLLGELDERGLLVGTISEHAALLHVTTEQINAVRQQIMMLEPVGVAATSIAEVLQTKIKAYAADKPWSGIALRLVQTQWRAVFVEMEFKVAARALGISQAQLLATLQKVTQLHPYPLTGLHDSQDAALRLVPDVRFDVTGTGNDAVARIEVLEQERYTIGINRTYLGYRTGADAALRQRLAEYRDDARFLKKAIEKRWKTLQRVCNAIFEAQRLFFTDGSYCPTTLRPLTRERIAEVLGMHPSTIGRAVEDKNAILPNGKVVPLRFFFDQTVPIRALLRRYVTAEPAAISDGDLCDYLEKRGWKMSRRAAAYHREAADILSKKMRSREHLLRSYRGGTAPSRAS